MKHSNRPKQNDDDEDDEAGEPADPRGRAPRSSDVRSSGIWERLLPRWGASPSAAKGRLPGGPCTSFDDVHHRYRALVWAKIQRPWLDVSDAKDIFQNVFVAIHERIHDRGMPADVELLLLTMVRRRVCDHQRDWVRRGRRVDSEADADQQPSSKPDPEQLYDGAEGRDEAKQRVEAIVARMPASCAEVFRMIELDGLSHEEVANDLGLRLGTVRVRLHRARAMFTEQAGRLYKTVPRGSK